MKQGNGIAVFAGSFDPYTLGHHEIVRKAAALFDEVHILIAVNTAKKRAFDAARMENAIRQTLKADGLDNVLVRRHEGLLTAYCRQNGIRWHVRGLRSATDYAYEENNAQINKLLYPEMETLYLRSESPCLSSSMVRELLAFGDTSAYGFVPESVAALIRETMP